MTVWMLGDDDAQAASGDVAVGDLVLQRSGDLVRVGVVQGTAGDPVDWRAEVDAALLPGRDRLSAAGGGGGLQRVDDIDGLEVALAGVLTAERDRGA